MDPEDKDSEKVILKTSRPIDKIILDPASPILRPPMYIYYNSNGAVTKVNKLDPTDKTVISRSGGNQLLRHSRVYQSLKFILTV